MPIKFRYLQHYKDRYGNPWVYVRHNGHKIRIKETIGSPEFARAYGDAIHRLNSPGPIDPNRKNETDHTKPGTLGWLAAQYFASTRFTKLDSKSQSTRRAIIEDCLREPPEPESNLTLASCPTKESTPAMVMMLMDRKVKDGKQGAANNRKKYLSAMFSWAVKNRQMIANPCRDVERASYSTDGFHTWTVEEVRQFEERHPVGTKARLAFALMLFTGARRGDVVTLGKQHVKDGFLRYIPRKTRHQRMTASVKPVLPILADIIAKSPTGELTFLVTKHGKPFTANGFGNWFRDRCDEAGLPQCSAHGLRKAGATIAAENGATDRQLMAMFDWTTPSQASVYVRAADKKRLAGDAARLMVGAFGIGTFQEQNCPTSNENCPTANLSG
jgi:integrase